jgi:hypothetical protein
LITRAFVIPESRASGLSGAQQMQTIRRIAVIEI